MYSGSFYFDETGKGYGPLRGWALCNGLNGTPNLQDRFVMGTTKASEVGNEGGSNNYILSIDNLPPHTHYASSDGVHDHLYTTLEIDPSVTNYAAGGFDVMIPTFRTVTRWTDQRGLHSHDISIAGEQGEPMAIDNRPAFVILAFIMKL